MPSKVLFFILLFPLYALAEPNPSLQSFQCTANNIEVIGEKKPCIDTRYQSWQKNGCYHIIVSENEEILFEEEMVRNLPFRLEKQQKFYAMYVWNQNEWAMRSFILEFEATGNRQLPRFQFDHREGERDPFQKIIGLCSLVKN